MEIGARFDERESEPKRFGPWWTGHLRVINGRTFAFVQVRNSRGKVVAIQVGAEDRPGWVHQYHQH
jgi:hypothetical protein